MQVAPHYDRWTGYDPSARPDGWREGWESRLLHNVLHLDRPRRQGALALLRALLAEIQPGSFCRDVGVAQTQDALERLYGNVDRVTPEGDNA